MNFSKHTGNGDLTAGGSLGAPPAAVVNIVVGIGEQTMRQCSAGDRISR
jgi:hypothetical protein